MTDSKAPYQPDPQLVRECATRIIEGQIEEIRAADYLAGGAR